MKLNTLQSNELTIQEMRMCEDKMTVKTFWICAIFLIFIDSSSATNANNEEIFLQVFIEILKRKYTIVS